MRKPRTQDLAIAALSFALGAGTMAAVPPVLTAAATPRVETLSGPLVLCGRTKAKTCVIDGDTLRIAGTNIRLADIDAPEIFSPKCDAEAALGDKATARLIALINTAPVALETPPNAHDKYGRAIRLLKRDGQSLGATMVAEGLAHVW